MHSTFTLFHSAALTLPRAERNRERRSGRKSDTRRILWKVASANRCHGISIMVMLAVALQAQATDTPHDRSCRECHQEHPDFGDQFDSVIGNENVCMSCHQPGGSAHTKALLASDQASLWHALTNQPPARGTSHRWDAPSAGRVIPLNGTTPGGLLPGGTYTGDYPKVYTVTMTSSGGVGVARFNWSDNRPGGDGGTNWLTAASVPLNEGFVAHFVNYRPAPAFRPGDTWQVLVRPELHNPSDPDVLWTWPGQLVCSTCHDPHYQAKEPFDSAAGRDFMRIDNDVNQLCQECHSPKFVTNAIAGSHPVGILVGSNAFLRPPATLPVDQKAGRMWCSTCHQMHGSPGDDGRLLRAKDESALCAECHALADVHSPATHLNRLSGPLWPGGQYGSLLPADDKPAHRGACANCHRVHGWPDGANPTNDYPSLLVEREENLCFTCHDGSPAAKNVRAEFNKTFKHPVGVSGRHQSGEAGNPAAYGTANRHSECADCHNSHATVTDTLPLVPPFAAGALRGVARVSVTNVSSSQVVYTYRSPTDPTPVKEYELCFLCHSGWTTRPSGQGNFAAEFNDKNPSYHPIEAAGKNLNINPNSFVNGWNATKLMYCTDCHTSDDPGIRGPHASTHQYILKKRTLASPTRRATGATMASDEHCFDCHRFDTYANNSASTTIKNYSRFAGEEGHTYHVGSRRYSCYNCHDSHGSSTLPNLLVTGRSPGLNTYTRTANGGTCTATCHGSESYSVTYAR